ELSRLRARIVNPRRSHESYVIDRSRPAGRRIVLSRCRAESVRGNTGCVGITESQYQCLGTEGVQGANRQVCGIAQARGKKRTSVEENDRPAPNQKCRELSGRGDPCRAIGSTARGHLHAGDSGQLPQAAFATTKRRGRSRG